MSVLKIQLEAILNTLSRLQIILHYSQSSLIYNTFWWLERPLGYELQPYRRYSLVPSWLVKMSLL